jgi:endoglucanase
MTMAEAAICCVASASMTKSSLPMPPLLDELLRVDAPSGHERPAAEIWNQAASSFADLSSDGTGSVIARVGEEAPLLAVFGHVDEIGMIVTHVDEKGFLWFAQIGYWDPQVLIGLRVMVRGRIGPVPGVIGRKPIHLLLGTDELSQGPNVEDLCIDIGATSEAEAAELVRAGDTAVAVGEPLALAGDRIASKGIDNRVGAYIALESLRRCAEGKGPSGSFAAVGSTQEEIGLFGARTSAFALRPDVAIAVDASLETDFPGVDKRRFGNHPFGSGPMIGRAPNLSSAVADLLVETAEEEGIDYTIASYGSNIWYRWITGADADAIQDVGSGIPTGMVSFPTRYMHSGVEMVDLRDIEAIVQLLAAVGSRIESGESMRPLGGGDGIEAPTEPTI